MLKGWWDRGRRCMFRYDFSRDTALTVERVVAFCEK